MVVNKQYYCCFCNKLTEIGHNYCSWECCIKEAKNNKGIVYSPNNLPINCIDKNNNMWECQHADHPDYKFPVEINTKITLSSLSYFDGATSQRGYFLFRSNTSC